jgi:hypothetical protein
MTKWRLTWFGGMSGPIGTHRHLSLNPPSYVHLLSIRIYPIRSIRSRLREHTRSFDQWSIIGFCRIPIGQDLII